MQFRSVVVALLSAPLLAFAQSEPNPFTLSSGFSATVGSDLELTWRPTTQGTVSLILRYGASNDLEAGTTIASNINNDGSYTWNPDSSFVQGSDYTVEIVDDADDTLVNYSPVFVLNSPNTSAPSSTSQVSIGASATSLRPASTSATVASTTSSATTTSGASSSTTSGATRSSTLSSSVTSSASTTSSSSSVSGAGFQGSTSSQQGAGAPRATAMAGLLGLVALGAMAL